MAKRNMDPPENPSNAKVPRRIRWLEFMAEKAAEREWADFPDINCDLPRGEALICKES